MKRRDQQKSSRCRQCRFPAIYCYCHQLFQVQSQTQVDIIMHTRELTLSSSTANLAEYILPHCQVHIRGQKDRPFSMESLLNGDKTPIFLFPNDHAQLLNKEALEKLQPPIQLIVPDGNWRQAAKVYKREEALRTIPSFYLDIGKHSKYFLRQANQDHHLCTLEAIAYALAIIESDKVKQELLSNLQFMVDAHLYSRYGKGYRQEGLIK